MDSWDPFDIFDPPDDYECEAWEILVILKTHERENQLRKYFIKMAFGNHVQKYFQEESAQIAKTLVSLVKHGKSKLHANRKIEKSRRERRFLYNQNEKHMRRDKLYQFQFSGCRKVLKQQTNKRLRQPGKHPTWMPPDIFSRPGGYRRILDYWWWF
jgi:hypothetical protein